MDNWKETILGILGKWVTYGYWVSTDHEGPVRLTTQSYSTAVNFFKAIPDDTPYPRISFQDNSNDAECNADKTYIQAIWENEETRVIILISYNSLAYLHRGLKGILFKYHGGPISYTDGPIPQEILNILPKEVAHRKNIYEILDGKEC